jgi:hypothetical protein
LFEHNPWITDIDDADGQRIELGYTDLIATCSQQPYPFLAGFCHDLGKKLGIKLELSTNRPHLYLSEEEMFTSAISELTGDATTRYWLLCAGIKNDFTLKQWPVEYYQRVVDHFRGRIQFVQVGHAGHNHPSLDGVTNLVGRTSVRTLLRLAYQSDGGLGPISFLQHVCAAFEKPYVALLGGREPVTWTQYALQTTLHTIGKLPCCATRACWHARVIPLNDGSRHDANLCEQPSTSFSRPVGQCMAMITPDVVVQAIHPNGTQSLEVSENVPEPNYTDQAIQNTAGEAEAPCLTAYSAWGFQVRIVPATANRDWMHELKGNAAEYCLPMMLAGQSGWFVLAPHSAVVTWNGGTSPSDLTITVPDGIKSRQAHSAVGYGIVTWTIPYVFRTSPGWNLLCRGPANVVKDGIAPLEGLVETDWSVASFSMNWKLTRSGGCAFEAGEPIAMLVPQKRYDLESFRPRYAELQENVPLLHAYRRWRESREAFWRLSQKNRPRKYQRHYAYGYTNAGIVFPDHQTTRTLREFGQLPTESPRTTSKIDGSG